LVFTRQLNPNSPVQFSTVESRKTFSYFSSDAKREGSHTGYASASSVSSGTTVSKNVIEYVENVVTLRKDRVPSLKKEPFVDNLTNYAAYQSWELQSTRFPHAAPETYSHSWEIVARSIYRDNDYQAHLADTKYFKTDIDKIIAGVPNVIQRA